MTFIIDPLDPRELTAEQAHELWARLPEYLTADTDEEHTP